MSKKRQKGDQWQREESAAWGAGSGADDKVAGPDLDELREELRVRDEALSAAQEDHEHYRSFVEMLENDLSAAQETIAKLRERVEALTQSGARLAEAEGQVAKLTQQLRSLDRQRQEAVNAGHAARIRANRLEDEVRRLAASAGASPGASGVEIDSLRARVDELAAAEAELRERLEEARQENQVYEESIAQARAEREAHAQSASSGLEELRRLQAERDDLERRQNETAMRLKAAVRALEARRVAQEAGAQRIVELEAELDNLSVSHDRMGDSLVEARGALAEQTARLREAEVELERLRKGGAR